MVNVLLQKNKTWLESETKRYQEFWEKKWDDAETEERKWMRQEKRNI